MHEKTRDNFNIGFTLWQITYYMKMYIKTKANKIVQEQNESLNRNPGIISSTYLL